jgi:hypothetical protein
MPAEFTTARSEGGLLPPDLLQRIAAGDSDPGGLAAADYGFPAGERLGEVVARAWARQGLLGRLPRRHRRAARG